MAKAPIAIASDHAGVKLKSTLIALLRTEGYEPRDLGPSSEDSVDYPDFAEKVAHDIIAGNAETGILICGTGIGISIAANRHKAIRAALCHNSLTAQLAREHNDANVLVLGARIVDDETAKECVRTFLHTAFEGGRHQRRVDKLSQ